MPLRGCGMVQACVCPLYWQKKKTSPNIARAWATPRSRDSSRSSAYRLSMEEILKSHSARKRPFSKFQLIPYDIGDTFLLTSLLLVSVEIFAQAKGADEGKESSERAGGVEIWRPCREEVDKYHVTFSSVAIQDFSSVRSYVDFHSDHYWS